MRWPEDARDWPLTGYSRFVLQRPHRWHIQEHGTGPTLLLIHGAGGATQSWRGIFPILAQSHHVVAMDLPGQGFTQLGARQRCGLDHMAEDLHALILSEGWTPQAIIGHSAGVALALRLTEMMPSPPPDIVGINAALGNFKGVAGWLYPVMAKLLALNPFTADLFVATSSSPRKVRKLIDGTGSHLDSRGLELYQRLARDRAHVDATLAMMSQWTLDGLLSRLNRITARTLLIVGDADRAVPPHISDEAAALIPGAEVTHLPGLGHLAHEESPALIADLIIRSAMAAPRHISD